MTNKNIFEQISNLKYKRNFSEAIFFYLSYCAIYFISVLFLVSIFEILIYIVPGVIYLYIFIISRLLEFLLAIIFSYLILSKKKLLNTKYVILLFLSGILMYVGGAYLGLISIAYLTMISSQFKENQIENV